MKASEYRDRTSEELAENLAEARKRLFFQMRMQKTSGDGAKPHEVRQLRREIARMATVIKERELAGAGGETKKG